MMAAQSKQAVPVYWLILAFTGYALLNLYYPLMQALGISAEKKFPAGFVVYVTLVWLGVVLVVLALRSRGWALRDIGITRPKGRWLLASLLCVVIGVCVVYPAAMLVNTAFGFVFKGMNFTIGSPFDVFVAVVICSLLGPLGEEILFRGVLIKIAQQKISSTYCVGALAVLCFAIPHGSYFGAGGMVFITLWTVLPVFLFLRYNSIAPAYVMHAANNFFAYFVLRLLVQQAG